MALAITLPLFGCGAGREQNATENGKQTMLAGGYTAQREPTKSEIAIFSEAISGQDLSAILGEVPFDLSSLEPVSVATQVVAGTNYKFICKAGAKGKKKVEVVVYRNLQGELAVTGAKAL